MTYSEHELEFTFAKNLNYDRGNQLTKLYRMMKNGPKLRDATNNVADVLN